MKKIIKEYNIYSYDELDENIKNELLEKEQEYQKEAYIESFLYNDMEDKAQELLKTYFKDKAELKNIYYDLSYCQGSGAMIEFDLYYYNKLVHIKQHGHYYHELSFIIDSYELTEKQEEQLKEKIHTMNKEFSKYGFSLIEEEPDKDFCLELLREKDYLKSGEVFY